MMKEKTVMNSVVIRHVIKIKKFRDDAILPVQSIGNVGYDLGTADDVLLLPHTVTKISLGWAFANDVGCCVIGSAGKIEDTKYFGLTPFFKIEGRSGLAAKGIFPVGGIIDPSYRGDVGVLLYNSTTYPYSLFKGDRVAQLVCYHTMSPSHVTDIIFRDGYEVVQTDRGEGGFGSSGS